MLIDIDFISDFVCPWCFLGKVRLGRAIEHVRASRPDLEVRINWLPFLLDPSTPTASQPYRAYLEAKFGGARNVDAMHGRIAEAAEPEGVRFAFDRIARRPNTLAAHRLMYRAQSLGQRPQRVAALGDALFAAHFQQGRDIGDLDTLVEVATAAGDRAETVRAYLDSDDDAAVVARMAAQVSDQGVTGVPFFIIDRKLAVSGAQSPAALGAAILQALG